MARPDAVGEQFPDKCLQVRGRRRPIIALVGIVLPPQLHDLLAAEAPCGVGDGLLDVFDAVPGQLAEQKPHLLAARQGDGVDAMLPGGAVLRRVRFVIVPCSLGVLVTVKGPFVLGIRRGLPLTGQALANGPAAVVAPFVGSIDVCPGYVPGFSGQRSGPDNILSASAAPSSLTRYSICSERPPLLMEAACEEAISWTSSSSRSGWTPFSSACRGSPSGSCRCSPPAP